MARELTARSISAVFIDEINSGEYFILRALGLDQTGAKHVAGSERSTDKVDCIRWARLSEKAEADYRLIKGQLWICAVHHDKVT